MRDNDLRTSVSATHPGEILKDILLGHGMSQKDLAAAIGKTTPVVNDIMSRRRDVNVEIAVLLEALFSTPTAKEWLDIQSLFDIELVRLTKKIKDQEQSILDWKGLGSVLNLRIINKRAGLGNSIQSDLNYICGLYGMRTADDLKTQLCSTRSRACFKKSEVLDVDERNLNTWLLLTRVDNDSCKNPANPFDLSKINELISRLNDIFYVNEDTLNKASSLLDYFGIKFLIEKKLEKVPVDGYSFWKGDYPTIVVTTRHNRVDNLAFTIFHELGHIVKHLFNNRDEDYLDTTEGNREANRISKEEEANDFARECLWRSVDFHKLFYRIKSPFSATPFLQRWAAKYQINEGILVGQYQHYCDVYLHHPSAYMIASKLKQKIR